MLGPRAWRRDENLARGEGRAGGYVRGRIEMFLEKGDGLDGQHRGELAQDIKLFTCGARLKLWEG